MTELEPEYDAAEREGWYDLAEYQAAVCPHCGNLRVLCSDPNGVDGKGFYPQLEECWVSAARERAQRKFDELHKGKKPDFAGYLPGDGVSIWASPFDLTPEADWLSEQDHLLPGYPSP